MPYPFWEPGLGYGPMMAIIAIVHVFVSHFAIGGGLYLVVAERSARKAGDEARLEFVRKLSKFFVLTTVVFGALTGVAIWFIIGLLNPKGTEALIHNFVWGWAIEWTFFIVEILAAILYYYGWKRLSAKAHMQIGWIYFVAAWLSLVVINGIITFMLTPGAWLETGSFWDGFLNPTYVSTVFLRTGICLVMAGLFALLVSSRYPNGDLKKKLTQYNAAWAVFGLVITGACWFWYRSVLATPGDDTTWKIATSQLTIAIKALRYFQITSYALFGLVCLFGFVAIRWFKMPAAIALMVLGLVWFGSFEWFREAARKPYVIHGYMYGNGIRKDHVKTYQKEGLLNQLAFRTEDEGRDLFMYACGACHQPNGYNPVLPAFDHTDRDYVMHALLNLHEMRGAMGEFPGTPKEAGILADWLWAQADQTPLPEQDLGAAVYEQRCARCHVFGGFNDKTVQLGGFEKEEFGEVLVDEEFLEDTGMPPFTGTERDRKALLDFLEPHFQKGGE